MLVKSFFSEKGMGEFPHSNIGGGVLLRTFMRVLIIKKFYFEKIITNYVILIFKNEQYE